MVAATKQPGAAGLSAGAAAGTKRKHTRTAAAAEPLAAAPAAALASLEDAMTAYFLEANTTDELGASLNTALTSHKPLANPPEPSADGGAPRSAECTLEPALDAEQLFSIDADLHAVAAAIVGTSEAGSGTTSPYHSATHAAYAPCRNSPAAVAPLAATSEPLSAGSPACGHARAEDDMALSSLDLWHVLDAFDGATGELGESVEPVPLGAALAPAECAGAARRAPGARVQGGAKSAGGAGARKRTGSAARASGATIAGVSPSAAPLESKAAAAVAAGMPPSVALGASSDGQQLEGGVCRVAGAPDDSDADGDGDGDDSGAGGSAHGGDLDERKQKRMRRNRESAMRSRHRRKAYIEELEAQVAQLRAQVARLASEGSTLRDECALLRQRGATGVCTEPHADAAGSHETASTEPRAQLPAGTDCAMRDVHDCSLSDSHSEQQHQHQHQSQQQQPQPQPQPLPQPQPQPLAQPPPPPQPAAARTLLASPSPSFRPEAAAPHSPLAPAVGAGGAAPACSGASVTMGTRGSSKRQSTAVAALAGCMLVCAASVLPGGGGPEPFRAPSPPPFASLWSSVARTPSAQDPGRSAAARRLLGLDESPSFALSHLWAELLKTTDEEQPTSAHGAGNGTNRADDQPRGEAVVAPDGAPITPFATAARGALALVPSADDDVAPHAPDRAPREPAPAMTPPLGVSARTLAPRAGGSVIRLPPNASWGDAELIELAERQLVTLADRHGSRRAEPVLIEAALASMPAFASLDHVFCPKTYVVPRHAHSSGAHAAHERSGGGATGDSARARGGSRLPSTRVGGGDGGGDGSADGGTPAEGAVSSQLPSPLSLLIPWETLAHALPGAVGSLLPRTAAGSDPAAAPEGSYAQVSCIVTNVTHFAARPADARAAVHFASPSSPHGRRRPSGFHPHHRSLPAATSAAQSV